MNFLKRCNCNFKDVSLTKFVALIFMALVVFGTLILMLPISYTDSVNIDFFTAFFTSLSSSFVSGLILWDTWHYWTWFGKFTILFLVQIGSISFITFMTGILLQIRRKFSIDDEIFLEFYTIGNKINVSKLLRTVTLFTFFVELTGSLIFMLRLIPRFGIKGFFVSIFLSVFSYCNSGFDVMGFEYMGVSLQKYANDPLMSITMSLLVLLGGLGFVVLLDLYLLLKEKLKINKSKALKSVHLNFHSKLVIESTIVIAVVSTVIILLLEYNNSFSEFNILQKINASFFLTCTSRGAGFGSMNPMLHTNSTKIFSCILMFIGASPCSTGGGIKTTTFLVILFTVISYLRGKKDISIKNHVISKELVYRSLTLVALSMGVVYVASEVILIFEGSNSLPYLDILFESLSAFSTGISVAASHQLVSPISKFVLSLLMLWGRIGSFLLFVSFIVKKNKPDQVILPETSVIIG